MTRRGLQSDRPFKILLIGDSGVGKTSLMLRFADNKFTESLTPTIGVDFKLKKICIRDETVHLQLWDTAGQEKFLNITRAFYRNADAILLVYDRTEASSFQHIANWMKNIDENAPLDVHRVLIANKSDVHSRIVISTEDGQKLADKYQIDFVQVSVKTNSDETISQIFYSIVEKLLDKNQSFVQPSTIKLEQTMNSSDSFYKRLTECC